MPTLATLETYLQQQNPEDIRTASRAAEPILVALAQYIKPGVTEGEMQAHAQTVFRQFGVEKFWHRPYIYFGDHSVLTYKDTATQENTLQAEDIAYIDLAPVIGQTEADIGRTYTTGNNPLYEGLKTTCEDLFHQAVAFWKSENPTGSELYRFIHQQTEAAGYIFHLQPAGHLIGSFPHKYHSTGGLDEYPKPIDPDVWILEIQIRHPEQPYGAFYEGLLS